MLLRRWNFGLFAMILFLQAGSAWGYSGDTIQDDIAREFSGGPSSYTIPLSATAQPNPPPSSCTMTLDQELADGQIQPDESCSCPTGATTPVCVSDAGQSCQDLLIYDQANYPTEQCTCAANASSPTCIPYYQLCEANLPNYQNSTNECTCSQTATSAIPACTSDYSICESNASSYENNNTRCSCSQTSTHPYCCTTTTTSECTTTYSIQPAVEEQSESPGVSTYCNGQPSNVCPNSDGGLQVCYEGNCRHFTESGGFIGGAHASSIWACGACEGQGNSAYCSSGEQFTVWYENDCGGGGPTVVFTGGNYSVPTTSCTPVTTQSCTTEP